MPQTTKTTWTCSRCGAEVVTDPTAYVSGWRIVKIEDYQPGSAFDYIGDYCVACRSKLLRFIEGVELIPEEGITIGAVLLDGLPQEHVGYWDSAGALPRTALPVHRDDQIEFLKTHRPLFAITTNEGNHAGA